MKSFEYCEPFENLWRFERRETGLRSWLEEKLLVRLLLLKWPRYVLPGEVSMGDMWCSRTGVIGGDDVVSMVADISTGVYKGRNACATLVSVKLTACSRLG